MPVAVKGQVCNGLGGPVENWDNVTLDMHGRPGVLSNCAGAQVFVHVPTSTIPYTPGRLIGGTVCGYYYTPPVVTNARGLGSVGTFYAVISGLDYFFGRAGVVKIGDEVT